MVPRTVSVVVPIHNEEENIPLLYRSLVEVLTQLGRPYEMILVDDGSTDRSPALLRELADFI